jgi:hypothetical protein
MIGVEFLDKFFLAQVYNSNYVLANNFVLSHNSERLVNFEIKLELRAVDTPSSRKSFSFSFSNSVEKRSQSWETQPQVWLQAGILIRPRCAWNRVRSTKVPTPHYDAVKFWAWLWTAYTSRQRYRRSNLPFVRIEPSFTAMSHCCVTMIDHIVAHQQPGTGAGTTQPDLLQWALDGTKSQLMEWYWHNTAYRSPTTLISNVTSFFSQPWKPLKLRIRDDDVYTPNIGRRGIIHS